MAWIAGDRLQGGKYIIERELGRGRFGITYLVKNRNSDRTNRAILTGMKLDPKQRSQSMREWLHSLALTGEHSQPSVIIPPTTNPTWQRNIQFWGVVIACDRCDWNLTIRHSWLDSYFQTLSVS
ncbi:MAG: hypothetical protein V7K90_30840 [Nostoc sp.]|uniref:hypothetical protein n=1 Tax=Nostoc sp. TaxID=1180 RepID=UPI002FFB7ECF